MLLSTKELTENGARSKRTVVARCCRVSIRQTLGPSAARSCVFKCSGRACYGRYKGCRRTIVEEPIIFPDCGN